jgi:hypothetical protein
MLRKPTVLGMKNLLCSFIGEEMTSVSVMLRYLCDSFMILQADKATLIEKFQHSFHILKKNMNTSVLFYAEIKSH